jgi:predicted nucleic acid-binding protein
VSRYLLDSNVVILHLRHRQAANELLSRWAARGDEACISAITRTEVLAGMRPYQRDATMAILDALISLQVTSEIADQAGQWIYQYARRGFQMDVPDALIAATAVRHGLTLVTTNARHFPVPGLQVLELE